jgi:hypothetical protein
MYIDLSPQVGLEPTTDRLTADRSTTELLRKIYIYVLYIYLYIKQFIEFVLINVIKKLNLLKQILNII